MKEFLTALKFLTIIPVPGGDKNFERSICFFPVTGLFLGLILAGLNVILSSFLPTVSLSIVLVAVLALLTGGLHLDGVADTFDALGAPGDRKKKLKIMKDSRLGAIGAVAVACTLLLKVGGLCSVPSEFLNRALILMPVLGRWSLTGACTFSSYAHERPGKASAFMKNRNVNYFVFASIFTLVVSLLCFGWKALVVLALVAAVALLLGKLLIRIFGGFSGDTLGMLNESIEILSIFFIAGVFA